MFTGTFLGKLSRCVDECTNLSTGLADGWQVFLEGDVSAAHDRNAERLHGGTLALREGSDERETRGTRCWIRLRRVWTDCE